MQMRHALSTVFPYIGYHAIPIAEALLSGYLGDDGKEISHQLAVGGVYGVHRLDMDFWDRQQMHRRQRSNILEHQYTVVLIDLRGGDLPRRNLAEQSVFHCKSLLSLYQAPGDQPRLF